MKLSTLIRTGAAAGAFALSATLLVGCSPSNDAGTANGPVHDAMKCDPVIVRRAAAGRV
jgi:hypothetical protein